MQDLESAGIALASAGLQQDHSNAGYTAYAPPQPNGSFLEPPLVLSPVQQQQQHIQAPAAFQQQQQQLSAPPQYAEQAPGASQPALASSSTQQQQPQQHPVASTSQPPALALTPQQVQDYMKHRERLRTASSSSTATLSSVPASGTASQYYANHAPQQAQHAIIEHTTPLSRPESVNYARGQEAALKACQDVRESRV